MYVPNDANKRQIVSNVKINTIQRRSEIYLLTGNGYMPDKQLTGTLFDYCRPTRGGLGAG